MWTNIGEKIKVLAKVLCWISIVLFVIFAIICFILAAKTETDELTVYFALSGFAALVLGPVLSWIGSFVLYGYGELVTSNKKIAENFGSTPLD